MVACVYIIYSVLYKKSDIINWRFKNQEISAFLMLKMYCEIKQCVDISFAQSKLIEPIKS